MERIQEGKSSMTYNQIHYENWLRDNDPEKYAAMRMFRRARRRAATSTAAYVTIGFNCRQRRKMQNRA